MPFGAYLHDSERYLKAHTAEALKRIAALYAARNWPEEYVEAHATHDDRLVALGHAMENGGFEGKPFWLKLRDLYTHCPNPSFHQDTFVDLFTCGAAPGPWACITEWERAVYDSLLDGMVAFRGSHPKHRRNMSRTFAPKVALRFAGEWGVRSTAPASRNTTLSPTLPTVVKRSCSSIRVPLSAGR